MTVVVLFLERSLGKERRLKAWPVEASIVDEGDKDKGVGGEAEEFRRKS